MTYVRICTFCSRVFEPSDWVVQPFGYICGPTAYTRLAHYDCLVRVEAIPAKS